MRQDNKHSNRWQQLLLISKSNFYFHLSVFKGTVSQNQVCLKTIWLNRPWWGHATVYLIKNFNSQSNLTNSLFSWRTDSVDTRQPPITCRSPIVTGVVLDLIEWRQFIMSTTVDSLFYRWKTESATIAQVVTDA